MDHSFWQSNWGLGQIGFHRADVNPNLVRHVQTWLPSASAQTSFTGAERPRILVPLAGKSVDVTWLASRGAHVVAAEFVEQAVRSYFAETNVRAEVQPMDVGSRFVALQSEGPLSGSVEFLVSDFFKLRSEHVGPITAIYDRAAFVAIDPACRVEYAHQLGRLCRPGARLLLVSFYHSETSGPPFSLSGEEVRRLLSPLFELTALADDDILEQEPRFKARGMKSLREHVWLGIRRT
jgi:thiopurine S-methyltransferase